jgi:hypothetical protein
MFPMAAALVHRALEKPADRLGTPNLLATRILGLPAS